MRGKLFCLFFCFGFSLIQAKEVNTGSELIEIFTSKQGFFQNSINAIVSDSSGFLWIGTPNGLVRYDGYSFDYYYQDPDNSETIPNNYIEYLFNDSFGRLWIGTRKGLCLYVADKEKFIRVDIEVENVVFIKEDTDNHVWIGEGEVLRVFNFNTSKLGSVEEISRIDLKEHLNGNSIIDIEFISKTEALIATDSNLYSLSIDNGQLIDFTKLELDFISGKFTKILKKENSLWIGTNSGLYRVFYEKNDIRFLGNYFNVKDNQFTEPCHILSLYLDNKKDIWIGTKNNGVLQYNYKTSNFINYSHDTKSDRGISSNMIRCFYQDAFGVLWIGTAQGGLNKLDKNQKPFHNYSHNPYNPNSISSNLITDITEDKEGKIWISFYGSEICRTQEELNLKDRTDISFDLISEKLNKFENQWVLSLYQDLKGYWWIGTNKGLYLYDEKKERLKPVQLKDKGKLVDLTFNFVIDQINSDEILFSGPNIFVLRNSWDKILNNQSIEIGDQLYRSNNPIKINDYVKDSFGDYWFASKTGLLRMSRLNGKWELKNHFTNVPNRKGLQLSENNIFSIHISLNKDIWLGTFGGGLIKIQLDPAGEPEEITNYRKKDGLPDEVVYGILEDEEGKLWISTDMGICRFDPLVEEFDIYDVNDGLSNNNFRQSAYLKTRSGIFLMGGLNGLTVFDPKQITKNNIFPKILIKGLKINNYSVVTGKKFMNRVFLEKALSKTEELTLEDDSRNIAFDIIVQHTSASRKNKLLYKLEGVNQNWIHVDAGKVSVNYTNLDKGTYVFRYKGANGDGLWSNEKELIIKVLAPWYLRRGSIIAWVLLGGVICFGIIYSLLRHEKLKQRLIFENFNKTKIEELNQAKLRFFTNISHDFKTPLSLIIGPLDKIIERHKNEENTKYFTIIQNNIHRLQRLIDQLISYRQAETGHLQIIRKKKLLGDFIYPIMQSFEVYAKLKGVNFSYKIAEPNTSIILDLNKTESVLMNLFSNAIKYADLDREVVIEVRFKGENNDTLVIEVSNTSKGLSSEKLSRIFERFYKEEGNNKDWTGTGIGLELCKSLVELLEGAISVTSSLNGKTIFVVLLPIDKEISKSVDIDKGRNFLSDSLPIIIKDEIEIEQNTSLPKLLIVDDEPDVRSFLLEAFKDKYNITIAVNGVDGFNTLKENTPDLIISDVMMPEMDGYEFCNKIKSSIEYCHIPVILLTALNGSDKKIEGLELGADDFVMKPFSIKYLEVRVKKLLENKKRVYQYFARNSNVLGIEESLDISDRDKKFLEKVSISIEKNMSDSSFGVEELNSDIGMSSSHLYRKLKELTGQTPTAYLRNFRLQKARVLLCKDTEMTAAEVMGEIGIESASYYSKAFKKLHGLSPSEFVKKKILKE